MKIAIAGYGVEGKASFAYWHRHDNDVVIVDEREHIDAPAGIETICGPSAFRQLTSFDLIIRTPGINPKKLPYGDAVWSATNEFFAKCPAPIIGVTGTKGKGTVCSLIYSMLRAAEKDVYLVGNIGAPALEILPKLTSQSIVVYELSSFQLWDIVKSPQVAVVLAIEPDHLDIHDDMADYVAAKARIVQFQSADDIVIFHKANPFAQTIAEQSAAQKISYPFAIDTFKDSLRLPGEHNQENASAAIAAVHQLNINDEAVRQGLQAFTGLPHRLKYVAEKHGVKYYDDSIATTPGSAVAALKSFTEPKVLLLGGSDKGADYAAVIDECAATQTRVIAIGETGDTIAGLCHAQNVECVREYGTMTAIVQRASDFAAAGSVVILSPASASFDMFKNYADRGDQFIAAVKQL